MTNVNEEGYLYGVTGGSGGYAETVFRHAAKTLFGRDIEGPIEFKTLRNSDFREVVLEVRLPSFSLVTTFMKENLFYFYFLVIIPLQNVKL